MASFRSVLYLIEYKSNKFYKQTNFDELMSHWFHFGAEVSFILKLKGISLYIYQQKTHLFIMSGERISEEFFDFGFGWRVKGESIVMAAKCGYNRPLRPTTIRAGDNALYHHHHFKCPNVKVCQIPKNEVYGYT